METKEKSQLESFQVQILDENGTFNPEFKPTLTQWYKSHHIRDFYLVSIMGAQSSGKSTLLNELFGTRFAMMDAADGRSRTTVGTWLANADHGTGPNGNPILVLDVEGTDSREREDMAKSFENKGTLFSIAVSEAVIINIWETDLGRHNAANYPILESVFAAFTRLLLDTNNRTKTLLLFCVRDKISTQPTSKIEELINQDVRRIWDKTPKNDRLKELPVTEFFQIEVFVFSHYVFQKEMFHQQVDQLRDWFMNKDNPHYIFTDERKRLVPLDGFGQYAEFLWREIMNDNELNLPSQREALSRLRCSDIKKETLEQFKEDIDTIRRMVVEQKLLRLDLGVILSNIESDTLSAYAAMASSYVTQIYEEERTDLKNTIEEKMYQVFKAHLPAVMAAVEETFRYEVKEHLSSSEAASSSLDLSQTNGGGQITSAQTESASSSNPPPLSLSPSSLVDTPAQPLALDASEDNPTGSTGRLSTPSRRHLQATLESPSTQNGMLMTLHRKRAKGWGSFGPRSELAQSKQFNASSLSNTMTSQAEYGGEERAGGMSSELPAEEDDALTASPVSNPHIRELLQTEQIQSADDEEKLSEYDSPGDDYSPFDSIPSSPLSSPNAHGSASSTKSLIGEPNNSHVTFAFYPGSSSSSSVSQYATSRRKRKRNADNVRMVDGYVVLYHTWQDCFSPEEDDNYPLPDKSSHAGFIQIANVIFNRAIYRFNRIARFTMLQSKVPTEPQLDAPAPSLSATLTADSTQMLTATQPMPSEASHIRTRSGLNFTGSDLSRTIRNPAETHTVWRFDHSLAYLRQAFAKELNMRRQQCVERGIQQAMRYLETDFKQRITPLFDISPELRTSPPPSATFDTATTRSTRWDRVFANMRDEFYINPDSPPTNRSPTAAAPSSLGTLQPPPPPPDTSPFLVPNTIWSDITAARLTASTEYLSKLSSFLAQFDLSETEMSHLRHRIDASLDLLQVQVAMSETEPDIIQKRLHLLFDLLFLRNSEGVPRHFTRAIDLGKLFLQAKTETLAYLRECAQCVIPFDSHVHSSLPDIFQSPADFLAAIRPIATRSIGLQEYPFGRNGAAPSLSSISSPSPSAPSPQQSLLLLRTSSSLPLAASPPTLPESSTNAPPSSALHTPTLMRVQLIDRKHLESLQQEIDSSSVKIFNEKQQSIDLSTPAQPPPDDSLRLFGGGGRSRNGAGMTNLTGAPWWLWIVLTVFNWDVLVLPFVDPSFFILILASLSYLCIQFPRFRVGFFTIVDQFASAYRILAGLIQNSRHFEAFVQHVRPIYQRLSPFIDASVRPTLMRISAFSRIIFNHLFNPESSADSVEISAPQDFHSVQFSPLSSAPSSAESSSSSSDDTPSATSSSSSSLVASDSSLSTPQVRSRKSSRGQMSRRTLYD